MLLDYLKWKNWIKLFLEKGSSLQPLFHNRAIGESKKVGEGWIHLFGIFFDMFDSNWEKLWKKVIFNKASDPRTLYPSKIGLVSSSISGSKPWESAVFVNGV